MKQLNAHMTNEQSNIKVKFVEGPLTIRFNEIILNLYHFKCQIEIFLQFIFLLFSRMIYRACKSNFKELTTLKNGKNNYRFVNLFVFLARHLPFFRYQEMTYSTSIGRVSVTLILFAFLATVCVSQRLSNAPDYQLDPAQLDFVYHNHEEMTRFLRFVLTTRTSIIPIDNFIFFSSLNL